MRYSGEMWAGNGRLLPLDILFLLVVVPAHMELKGISFLLVVPLFFYLLLEIWHPLTLYRSLPTQFGKTRIVFLCRFFLMLVIVTGAAIIPTFTNIYSRLAVEPDSPDYLDAYANIHDGAVQVELALDFLKDGKNPYVERYDDTPLQYYSFSGIELPSNPFFEHFVYLPGLLILSYPAHQIFAWLDILYDQRWIYLLAYILFVLLLPQLVEPPILKLALLSGVALNPLLTGPVIIGMNDVIALLPLVLVGLALSQKQFLFSAVLFGLVCTLKQSAWFFAPFYTLWLFSMLPHDKRIGQVVKYLFIAGCVAALIVVPFALWSLPDFIDDVFAYPGGAVTVNYPIRGYTVGVLLVGAGFIESPLDPFPFWILQIIVALPLMMWLLRYQWQQNNLGTLFIAAGVLVFGVGLVSRFFQSNYVGFVVLLISLGFLMNLADFGNDQTAILPQPDQKEPPLRREDR